MHMHTYIHTYIHAYTCTHARTRTQTHTHTRTQTHTHTRTHTHAHKHTHTHARAHAIAHARVHTRTRTLTHTYAQYVTCLLSTECQLYLPLSLGCVHLSDKFAKANTTIDAIAAGTEVVATMKSGEYNIYTDVFTSSTFVGLQLAKFFITILNICFIGFKANGFYKAGIWPKRTQAVCHCTCMYGIYHFLLSCNRVVIVRV